MNLVRVRAELEGLSEAQLRMLVVLSFKRLPENRRNLLLKLADQMRLVNKL
ncbi:MAG: hypothetical protein HWN68_17160 [Desulfobacterales bacterium]|nr:hypothetical protein [Desulfobacterales bacterium]